MVKKKLFNEIKRIFGNHLWGITWQKKKKKIGDTSFNIIQ